MALRFSLISGLTPSGIKLMLRGKLMKSILVASALLLASSASAFSADLAQEVTVEQAAAPFSWTGGYAGLVGSYNWAKDSTIDTPSPGERYIPLHTPSRGFGVGGTLGYNWQLQNNIVLGVEGDLSWMDVKGAKVCNGGADDCKSKLSWLGTVRPRVGFAVDRLMPYVTGGVAIGRVEEGTKGNSSSFNAWQSKTRVGWAAGVGAEYAVTDNWTIKAEYLHVDLGNKIYDGKGVNPYKSKWISDSIRGGVNYRF